MYRKRILVTGATGFLGRSILDALNHYPVRCVASSRNVRKAKRLVRSHYDYFPHDISNKNDDYHPADFCSPDTLIHLAWDRLNHYNDASHCEEQLFAHYRFIKQCVQKGVSTVLIAGTCFEYGKQEGCLSEDTKTRPLLSYAKAKDSFRKFLEQLQSQYDFRLIWCRYFYLYGERQSQKSLYPQLIRAIQSRQNFFEMSPGDQQRDYLPVEKAAEYTIRILLQEDVSGIINCCSGQAVSIKDFVDSIIKRHNNPLEIKTSVYPYLSYEPHAFWGDDKKLMKALRAFDRIKEHFTV